jgi:hypothetical protein
MIAFSPYDSVAETVLAYKVELSKCFSFLSP